jgi:Fic family protein
MRAVLALLASGKLTPLPHGKYLHWDELRRRTPPEGLTHETWWTCIKLLRLPTQSQIPLKAKDGTHFTFTMPDPILDLLHRVDRGAGGHLALPEEATSPEGRDRYIVSSLIEEAITSSQLEGAATTRRVARDLLRSGRRPTDKSERMIINNYEALAYVRACRDRELTPETVLSLHRVICDGTIDDPTRAGALRTDADSICVTDILGTVLHDPPPSAELPERLDLMCRFANGEIPDRFLHPVIRAILVHFWLAYDHPFVDGNGRTARALFYWSMLRSKYWLCEYISISDIVKRAPAKYARALLYSETDSNDLTYFVLHQLTCVLRALEALQSYLLRKARQIRDAKALLNRALDLINHRQLALLTHALKKPGTQYTIESHRRSHNTVYQTARSDLLGLVELGLLTQARRSRRFIFTPVPNLPEALTRLNRERAP